MKMRKNTMKMRMTLWITLIGVVLSALMGVFVFWGGQAAAENRTRTELEDAVMQVFEALNKSFGLPDTLDQMLSDHPDIGMVLTDSSGRVLAGLLGENDFPAPDSKKFRDGCVDGESVILYDKKVSIHKEKYFLRGWTSQPSREEVFDCMLPAALIALPVFGLLLAVACYLVSKRTLAELDRVTAGASAIADGSDLCRTFPLGKKKDEVYDLTCSLNRMLERLNESVGCEKSFLAGATSEMRLAVESLLHKANCAVESNGQTEQDWLADGSKQLLGLRQLIEDLERVSTIDRMSGEREYQLTDVSTLIKEICADRQTECRNQSIALECTTELGISAEINPLLFRRLLESLISDGIRFGKKDGKIRIELSLEQSVDLRPMLVIGLWDDGSAVSEGTFADRTASAARGARTLPSIRWIVAYHCGSVQVRSIEGKGNFFRISLPLRQTASSGSV